MATAPVVVTSGEGAERTRLQRRTSLRPYGSAAGDAASRRPVGYVLLDAVGDGRGDGGVVESGLRWKGGQGDA